MNEMWVSEVERRLRAISDKLTSLNQADLRIQGSRNFGFPVGSNPEFDETEEIAWIRLTDKTVIGGINTYAWRRQVYVMTGGGMAWVDSGESGTFSENPAIGLNNEDESISDGKRYPAKFNPDTSQWIFFLILRKLPPSTDKFTPRCRVRQIGGYHYPGQLLEFPVEYTSPTTPENLVFLDRNRNAAFVPNSSVSGDAFAWTELVKFSESLDGDGNAYAEYRALDNEGREIGYLKITEGAALDPGDQDVIVSRKTVRQFDQGVLDFTFVTRVSDTVASSEGVLRNNTSGNRTTGYTTGGGFRISFTQIHPDRGPDFYGGNSNHEICWGDGCISPIESIPPSNASSISGTINAIAVRNARSVLSNTIRPSLVSTSCTVQFGPEATDPMASIVGIETTCNAAAVSMQSIAGATVGIATTMTAYTYSESTLSPAWLEIDTSCEAIRVRRWTPVYQPVSIYESITPIAIISPVPTATTASVSTSSFIVKVEVVSASSSSTIASTCAIVGVKIIVPDRSELAIETQLTAIVVASLEPSEAMAAAVSTVAATVVNQASITITESNPRITITTACTATADESGITPK